MRKKPLIIGMFILIALVAILTNPNEEKHRNKVKSIAMAQVQKSIGNELSDVNGDWENIAQDASLLMENMLINQLVNSMVTSTDFILFSTTNLVWSGESKTVGIGLFGHVFISSKVDELLENGFMELFR